MTAWKFSEAICSLLLSYDLATPEKPSRYGKPRSEALLDLLADPLWRVDLLKLMGAEFVHTIANDSDELSDVYIFPRVEEPRPS